MGEHRQRRFPDTSHIVELIAGGAPAAMTILGDPECQVRVYPQEKKVEALVRNDSSSPPVRDMKFISTRRVELDYETWNAVGATWVHSPLEAYLFVCDVIDRVQLMNETLATATDVVLHGMRALLRREAALSREAELGLIGELLVFRKLLDSTPAQEALNMWRGPDSEEHDFTLEDVDIEVKTTASEKREHWITSAQQLAPAVGRPLILVSIQMTPKAGKGSVSLPKLVRGIEDQIGECRLRFLDKLQSVGFESTDADLYPTEWALRTPSACFDVDETFPKITPNDLAGLISGHERITDLRYRISLVNAIERLPCRFASLSLPSGTYG